MNLPVTLIACYVTALCLGASLVGAQEAGAPLDTGSADESPSDAMPTMSDALDDAARSAKGFGAALMDSARDALSNAETSIAAATEGLRDGMAEGVTVLALDAADDVDALSAWVKREDIVTKDGIDFDRALAAVDASDYSEDRKAAMTAAITSVREAIDQARQGLSDLNTELQGDG